MIQNTENKTGGLLWRGLSGIMLLGSAAALAYILISPRAVQLELPSAVHIALSKHNTYMRDVCIEGVLYSSGFGLPETAVLGADGKAQRCSGGKAGLADLGYRFRLVCRDGIEYVKMRAHREDAMFVRYDTDSLLPKRCGE